MAKKHQPQFDPKSFLPVLARGIASPRTGRTKSCSRRRTADAVFYVQKGKVRISVVSDRGKKPSSQSWARMYFSAKAAFQARSYA